RVARSLGVAAAGAHEAQARTVLELHRERAAAAGAAALLGEELPVPGGLDRGEQALVVGRLRHLDDRRAQDHIAAALEELVERGDDEPVQRLPILSRARQEEAVEAAAV